MSNDTEPVPMDWAIVDEDGVIDRFATKAEARAALVDDGYDDGCRVAFAPDPFADEATS